MDGVEKEITDLRDSGKYGGHKPYASVEAFLSVRNDFKSLDVNTRTYQLRKLFLDMLMFPEFHVMTTPEKAEAIGIEESTVKQWMMQVPDEYLGEALKISRERHARQSFEVDASLMRECKEGNVKAMDLYYRRIEGWVPKQDMELSRGRDKELDSRANMDLLRELVKGLSPSEKAELLGNGVVGALEAKVEGLGGVMGGADDKA